MEMLQGVWKQHLRPRAVVGYGVKIFLPSPPNYVIRSPGKIQRKIFILIVEQYTTHLNAGAYEKEHATPLYSCHGVFIDRFMFRKNLLGIRLPWECHDQSQDTN